MAELVYLLCALTSTACAFLLARAYRSNGTRLLLWSTLGFAGLALNNALLFADLIVFPNVNLLAFRTGSGCLAVTLFLGGLIWDTD